MTDLSDHNSISLSEADSDSESENVDNDYLEQEDFSDFFKTCGGKSCNPVDGPGPAAEALVIKAVVTDLRKLHSISLEINKHKPALWALEAANLLDREKWKHSQVGWSGFDPAKATNQRNTDSKYLQNLKDLTKANANGKSMLRKSWSLNQWNQWKKKMGSSIEVEEIHKVVLNYFQVPKETVPSVKDRGIGDSRGLNKGLKKTIGTQFASLIQIFSCLRAFSRPSIYGGDLQSYFNQISIPDLIKALCSILVVNKSGDTEAFEYNTLPMGLVPSCGIAHAITTAWVMLAAIEAGYKIEDYGDSAPPPVVRVLKNEVIVAFIVTWVDNYLVIADSIPIRDQIKASMETFTKVGRWNIHIKPSSTFCTLNGSPFEFLGISWKAWNHTVDWKHIDSNLSEWAALLHLKPGQATKARAIAKRTGIIMYDFSVRKAASGGSLHIGEMDSILDLMGYLSKGRRSKKDWSKLIELNIEQTENILMGFRDILYHTRDMNMNIINPEFSPSKSQQSSLINRSFWTADASNQQAAVVHLNNDGSLGQIENHGAFFVLKYNSNTLGEHINVKETLIGIAALELAAQQIPLSTEVLLAVDNSTSRAAIRNARYPGRPDITQRLLKVHQLLLDKKSAVTVCQVPSLDMVADDPSRLDPHGNTIHPSQHRAAKCFNSMGRALTDIANTKRKRPQ